MDDAEQERREQAWVDGNRAALVSVLHHVLRELGYDRPETCQVRWVAEREAAIAQLRMLCADFGDNEWEPSLHLADVIDKHLGDHLNAPE